MNDTQLCTDPEHLGSIHHHFADGVGATHVPGCTSTLPLFSCEAPTVHDDIRECGEANHGIQPHHHFRGEPDEHTETYCVGCGWGAPLYQRRSDVVEQVRKVIEAGCAWNNADSNSEHFALDKVKTAVSYLPRDWANHVAIVRKLTRDELMAMTGVPEGLVCFDKEGDLWHRFNTVRRPSEIVQEYGFRAAYLLPMRGE